MSNIWELQTFYKIDFKYNSKIQYIYQPDGTYHSVQYLKINEKIFGANFHFTPRNSNVERILSIFFLLFFQVFNLNYLPTCLYFLKILKFSPFIFQGSRSNTLFPQVFFFPLERIPTSQIQPVMIVLMQAPNTYITRVSFKDI